jgi:hypothetical protein
LKASAACGEKEPVSLGFTPLSTLGSKFGNIKTSGNLLSNHTPVNVPKGILDTDYSFGGPVVPE